MHKFNKNISYIIIPIVLGVIVSCATTTDYSQDTSEINFDEEIQKEKSNP